MTILGSRGRGGGVRAFVGLALAAVLTVSVLAGASILVGSRQYTMLTDRRMESTAAVGAGYVSELTTGLQALVGSYATQPSFATDLEGPRPVGVAAQLRRLDGAGAGLQGSFTTDLTGTVTAAAPADPALIGQNLAHRDWYRGATASGRPYVSTAYRTELPGHALVVAVADEVRDAAGRPVAVLVAVLDLDTLRAVGASLSASLGVGMQITDQAGTLVDGTTPAGTAPGTTPAGPTQTGTGSGAVSIASSPAVTRARAGRSGVLTVTPTTAGGARGAPELSGYAPVTGTGWTVVASLPVKMAFATFAVFRDTVLTITVALGALLVAGAALFTRTDRRHREAEQESRGREAELARALESTDEAFVAIDTVGVITGWSARAEQLFGWAAPDVVGRPVFQTVLRPNRAAGDGDGDGDSDSGQAQREVDRYLSGLEPGGAAGRAELHARHRDGHDLPVEVVAWAHADGRGFSGFAHDITERVALQTQREAAREEALSASRLKSEFLANMSHEIRTPMNGVLGMTELILRTELDPDQRDYAETVRTSADALLAVIDDILDFSKIEAGRLTLESVPFDLAAVVEGAAALLTSGAHAHGLELTCRIDPGLPATLLGDPGRLRQVLLNLVGNAVKFTARGAVTVAARVGPDATGGERATPTGAVRVLVDLSVTDTGIGMTAETMEQLFHPFTQADSSTTRRFGGTGLGLSISRQLVELMGGTLGMASEPAVGSTFTARIPFEVVPEVVPAGVRPVPGRPAGGSASERLLVVEDNVVNQKVFRAQLSRLGYPVDVAGNGAEGLRRLESARYAAVLMDCQMPVMDGYEATSELRRREQGAHHTPVIAITASAMATDRARCVAAGMDDYLTKPLDSDTLAQTLNRWIHAEASSASPVDR